MNEKQIGLPLLQQSRFNQRQKKKKKHGSIYMRLMLEYYLHHSV